MKRMVPQHEALEDLERVRPAKAGHAQVDHGLLMEALNRLALVGRGLDQQDLALTSANAILLAIASVAQQVGLSNPVARIA